MKCCPGTGLQSRDDRRREGQRERQGKSGKRSKDLRVNGSNRYSVWSSLYFHSPLGFRFGSRVERRMKNFLNELLMLLPPVPIVDGSQSMGSLSLTVREREQRQERKREERREGQEREASSSAGASRERQSERERERRSVRLHPLLRRQWQWISS